MPLRSRPAARSAQAHPGGRLGVPAQGAHPLDNEKSVGCFGKHYTAGRRLLLDDEASLELTHAVSQLAAAALPSEVLDALAVARLTALQKRGESVALPRGTC